MATTRQTPNLDLTVVDSPIGDGGQALTNNFDLIDDAVIPTIIVAVGNTGTPTDRVIYTNTGTVAEAVFTTKDTTDTGLTNTFICDDNTNGIKITAYTGQKIRLAGGDITKSGGYIESITPGSSIKLEKITATEWIATSWFGTWVVETA